MKDKKIIFSRTGKEREYSAWWIKQDKARQDETLMMHGMKFFVAHDVFSPSAATTNSVDLLLRHLPDMKGKRVLDIGTGCGVFAMKAALEGAKAVVGTEINPSALENAKKNMADAKLEGIVNIINDERFENISGIFDVIIMNLVFVERPIDPEQIDGLGKQSLSLHRRLLAALPRMLAPAGVILLGFASFGDIKTLQELLNSSRLNIDCISEKKFGVNWYAITLKY